MFTAWNKYLFTCLNSGSCARENMNFYRNQVEAVYFYNAMYLALYSSFPYAVKSSKKWTWIKVWWNIKTYSLYLKFGIQMK